MCTRARRDPGDANFVKALVFALVAVLAGPTLPARGEDAAKACGKTGVWLQVLGSGGPELTDRRASSSYLVWRDGSARVLVDMGGGSLLNFERSGARIEDLQAILLSHLHVDHSADLPALIKASFFTSRTAELPLYGPTGNELFPDTTSFVRSLFGAQTGAFRYLNSFLTGDAAYRLSVHDVSANGTEAITVVKDERFRLSAVPVHHGPVPALAWRVDIAGRALAFSGDMNGDNGTLDELAENVDLLVAHNAVPEAARGVERNLHMPPSVIGEIAAAAKAKSLVLSHRMNRTLGREAETEKHIRTNYRGPMAFANDGDCFQVGGK